MFQTAFNGPDPLLRHVRTRVRSPQTNGVVERFFGRLKYEHLYRGIIADGDALDMGVQRFRLIYDTIRPHTPNLVRTPPRGERPMSAFPFSPTMFRRCNFRGAVSHVTGCRAVSSR